MTRDPLWRLASTRGLSRRRFLGLLAAGGAAAVLAACFGEDEGDGASSGLFKDPGPFIAHGEAGLESRLELMDGVVTPNRLFFVRNNSPESPQVDAAAWRLTVEGDAIDRPLELSYDELRRLPARTLVSYLECAGNHRVMFDRLQGRAAQGTQWGRGAVGNGVWLGVALHDVLTLAGIDDDAVSVLLVGLDEGAPEGGFRRVVTAQKAMHPDTLLAYGLNGEICRATTASRCARSCPAGSAARASSGSAASSSRASSSGRATTPPRTCSSATTTRPTARRTGRP